MDKVTKQVEEEKVDCDKHGKHMSIAIVNTKEPSEAEQCSSMSTTPTTAAIQHQQEQDAATMPTVTVSSRPSRPLVLPASAEDSVRRYYVSPTLQATASRLIAVVNSLRQQSNDVNNAGSTQPEDLPVAFPAEEDEVHGYAVSHDVSQHERFKKVQMVQARRDSCRLYFGVFLLIAAAVVIASLVVIKKNKSDGQEQETETETTMMQNMTKLIMSIMGADAVLLNNPLSPYTKALNWLLQSSERNKSQEMTSTLVQRFYLASFYYDTTTDDDKWTDCNPPNSSSELNQTCYDSYSYTIAQAWLSDSHECDWAGVFCDYHQQITKLGFADMNLVGTIPSSVAKFPFLYHLWITSSQLEGNISLLSSCHHLRRVFLEDNLLSGDLFVAWQNRKLTQFDVPRNNFSGSLSLQIGNSVDLKVLYLYGNKLTGTIPNQVGWFDSIFVFDLTDNYFQGKLPLSIQLWSMIQVFSIRGNSISGSIPTFLGQLNKTLWELDFSVNNFTGTLPDELFHLSQLLLFDVRNNELSGTLDARIAQFASPQLNTTLVRLGLSDNHFSGTIPTELGLLTDLERVLLDNNDFTGSVSSSLCQNQTRYPDFILSADCAEDDNGQVKVQCDCCNVCCQAGGTQCGPP